MLRLQVEAGFGGLSEEHASTVLITSSLQSEGKTTIACNLAVACAVARIPTLLIDTDIRKPMVHRAFNLDRTPGLTDAMMQDIAALPQVMPTEYPFLSVITAGKHSRHSNEILGSPAFSACLQQLKKEFRFIVLDSPPTALVSDAGVLASKVDSIYMVVHAGKTNRRTVEKAIRALRDIGGNVKGIIMSRCDTRRDRYYYYHYYPSYYSRYYREEFEK